MSTTSCWVDICKRNEVIQNSVQFWSNYRLPQHLFNSWTLIWVDYKQIINKITKSLRVILWQFFSRIFLNRFRSFKIRKLHVRFFLCHEFVCNDAERPDIHRRVWILQIKLLNWSIKCCHRLFHSCNRPALRFVRCTEISYQESFLVSNQFLENIAWFKITMHYLFWMEMG